MSSRGKAATEPSAVAPDGRDNLRLRSPDEPSSLQDGLHRNEVISNIRRYRAVRGLLNTSIT